MICKGCGAEIQNDQLFCPKCGTKNEPVQMNTAGSPMSSGPRQMPPYQMPGQQAPQQPRQMPPYQMPGQQQPQQGQVPPYQMPGQQQPQQGQVPPYQMPGQQQPQQGQVPPYQMPGQQQPSYGMPAANTGKQKSKLLPILVIIGAVILIIGGIIGIIAFIDQLPPKDKAESVSVDDLKDYIDKSLSDNIITVIPEPSNEENSEPVVTQAEEQENVVNFIYSYSELPDTISIDQDARFSYYSYSPDSKGITVYEYMFNDSAASDSDFYTAVQDYCNVLITWSGYTYDDGITQSMNNQSGMNSQYYAKDDVCVGVTASIEDTGRYAYISLFDRSISDYVNFYKYLEGRDKNSIDFSTEVVMENGIAFYLNDVYLTDNGDGTATVDCSMDLAAVQGELYSDDFMVIPLDADGNAIGDAVEISSIVDENGSSLTTPVVLDPSYYYSYTVSFTVPSDTVQISFYGVNIELDSQAEYGVSASGPVYNIDITFE